MAIQEIGTVGVRETRKASSLTYGIIMFRVNKNETAAFDGSIGLHKKERAFSRYLLQPLQNFTMDTEKYEF